MHEIELSFLSDFVDPQKRSIDVGANVGIYSYALARLGSTVESFEPLAECAAVISAFVHPRINVHCMALSDSNKEMIIHIPVLDGHPNAPLASLEHGPENGGHRRVQVRKLDSFGFSDVGFIKIDVEGHERRVIQGALETLRNSRPILLVEIEQRYHANEPIENIMSDICALGYKGGFYRDGQYLPLSEFSLTRHQELEDRNTSPYVNNFFFTPV